MARGPLPAAVLQSLRAAWDGEVADRLPRLEAALAGAPYDATELTRDAHSLGSSGFVVGADQAALAARALEDALVRRLPPQAALTELVRLLRADAP